MRDRKGSVYHNWITFINIQLQLKNILMLKDLLWHDHKTASLCNRDMAEVDINRALFSDVPFLIWKMVRLV